MKRFLLVLSASLVGCTTSPVSSEMDREIVLQHLGGSEGTAGPFSKGAKKELAILSPGDQRAGAALIDRGAVAFLVYESGAATATRVILVLKGRVVGDYRAPQKGG